MPHRGLADAPCRRRASTEQPEGRRPSRVASRRGRRNDAAAADRERVRRRRRRVERPQGADGERGPAGRRQGRPSCHDQALVDRRRVGCIQGHVLDSRPHGHLHQQGSGPLGARPVLCHQGRGAAGGGFGTIGAKRTGDGGNG
ncbi:hypothetical protein DIE18_13010 [Burkholderia sp. Bp9125]|nr:hypothetical protein DIE18_13010 [Burkholderia sp. Bp9125]